MAMKATGILRPVDSLGRIVIPAELRRTLDVGEGDAMEIFLEENNVVLRKYQPSCIFCGNSRKITTFKGRNICPDCLEEIHKTFA